MADRDRVMIDIVARDIATSAIRDVRQELDKLGPAGEKAGDKTSRGLRDIDDGAKKAKGGLSSLFEHAGKLAALAATGYGASKLFDYGRDAVAMASDLQETGTKLQAVFGEGTSQVEEFAARGPAALGQTSLAIKDAAATFGVFGKAAGLAGADNAKFSTDLASLSTDLASFYNADPAAVVEALGAGLRGEAEPLRQFGILMDDATMRQKALELGLISTTKEALEPQQKVLAAQALIMEQTQIAQGDFAKTSGGLANQQRILNATWEEGKAKIGQAFLPMVTAAVTSLNKYLGPALDWVAEKVPVMIEKVSAGFQEFKAGLTMGTSLRAEFAGQTEGLVTFGSKVRQVADYARTAYMVIFKGQFEGQEMTGGLGAGSPVIRAMFNIREGMQTTAAVVRTLVTGTFDPAQWPAGIGATPIVSKILNIRDTIQDAAAVVRTMVSGDFDPSQWGSSVSEDSPIVDKVLTIREKIGEVIDWIKTAWANVSGVVQGAWAAMTGGDKQQLWDSLGGAAETTKGLVSGIWSVAQALPSFSDLLNIAGGILGFVADHIDTLIDALPFLIAAWAAYKVSQMAANVAMLASLPLQAAQIASNFALAGANRALATALGYTHVGFISRIGAVISTTASFIASTAATVAHGVATAATTVATKAAAAATWLFSAALRANPIVLVVTALAALAGAVIWAYNNVDWFREMVDTAWSWIKEKTQWLWENWLQPIFGWISENIHYVGDAASWLWNEIIVPAWEGIVNTISWAWENIISPYLEAWWTVIDKVGGIVNWLYDEVIKPVWENLIAPAISTVWENIIKPAWEGLKGFIEGIGGLFEGIKTGVVEAATWITESITDITEKMQEFLGLGSDEVSVNADGSVTVQSGTVDVLGTDVPTLPFNFNADGGPITGPGGPRADRIPSFLSDGEFVINSTSTSRHRPLLEAINADRGFADGGMVTAGYNLGYGVIAGHAAPLLDAKRAQADAMAAVGAGVGAGIMGAFTGGAGVEQWRSLALAALAATGESSTWINAMLSQMQTESGGNPNAINLGDSNAAKGIPSGGLLQVVQPTFEGTLRGTKWESLIARGRFDPWANMIAAILYTRGAYGSLAKWNESFGGTPNPYDNGGLFKNNTMGFNTSGETEAVLTGSETKAYQQHAKYISNGGGGKHVTIAPGAIQITVQGNADPVALRRELEQALRDILADDAARSH